MQYSSIQFKILLPFEPGDLVPGIYPKKQCSDLCLMSISYFMVTDS